MQLALNVSDDGIHNDAHCVCMDFTQYMEQRTSKCSLFRTDLGICDAMQVHFQ